jgi:hypothetical protein
VPASVHPLAVICTWRSPSLSGPPERRGELRHHDRLSTWFGRDLHTTTMTRPRKTKTNSSLPEGTIGVCRESLEIAEGRPGKTVIDTGAPSDQFAHIRSHTCDHNTNIQFEVLLVLFPISDGADPKITPGRPCATALHYGDYDHTRIIN